jgi:hypothetical protein
MNIEATETKTYDCWQCGTAIDRPCPPERGGFTCACGNSYHNPDVQPQTAVEFFGRLAAPGCVRVEESDTRSRRLKARTGRSGYVNYDMTVGNARVRVGRVSGLPLVHLSVGVAGGGGITVGLSFEQVDELCEALAAAAPVPYVPELPDVSVMTAPRR